MCAAAGHATPASPARARACQQLNRGTLPALAAAVLLAGLFFAPTMIVAMSLVEQRVPASRLTEGMTWLLAGLNIGVALGALGDGSRPVNVLWALGALLGLHALTFLLWLASFLVRASAMTGLGRLWLWATRKLARGPDGALVPQACLLLLARAGALRWLFGAISHLLWLAALCAALAALLAVLSTASYRFIWATTLLAPDTFSSAPATARRP
ncbi:hypothetical protein G6F50_014280 [Rhizopus delemar]|uniref:Uncharacterized protein n=1 Tax=Rhizopus delemar TaxID=936053 RepID=A0A9P7C8T2_9FUNG|nr:hypothetical protein G6F50_014280 [Rhizopus delemar]